MALKKKIISAITNNANFGITQLMLITGLSEPRACGLELFYLI